MYAISGITTKDPTDTRTTLGSGAGAPPLARTNAADVGIVGAGPAGSWAAYTLARRGARVTIFDASHPREKPCGGGVTDRALALVADAIASSSFPAALIHCARFLDTPAGRSALVPLPERAGAPPLVVSSREAFDAALLTAACEAGATLVRSRVTDVSLEPPGVRIRTGRDSVRVGFLIGADGANSLVRRRFARPFGREDLSIATGYFAHGVTSDEIAIELLNDPPGYIWSFPRPTHLAVGICAQADTGVAVTTLRERTASWIRATGIGTGARLEPYSWPIPSLGVRTLSRLDLAGPNWCLTGDAAGLVDPITREGIYFALLSGQWAAEAALVGDASRYADRVRAEILPELVCAARLKSGFFRLASSGLLIHALRQSGAVRQVMADLIAGRQEYAGLKWKLLRTLEWQLAWKAIVSARNTRRAPAPGHRAATPSLRSPATPDAPPAGATARNRADIGSAARPPGSGAATPGASGRR
jgi:geranylgeranyl reductase family protein